MKIEIKNNSDKQIYEQIIIQIKNCIIAGEIEKNAMLPSIRSLAKDLQISVITTKRAYEELEKEGLIYSQAGKGFYVSENNVDILREKKISMIENKIEALVLECLDAGLTVQDIHDIIDELAEDFSETPAMKNSRYEKASNQSTETQNCENSNDLSEGQESE